MTNNTGNNRKPGTFIKGDPRINRKGRPRTFDKLRELAQSISHEVVFDSENEPLVIDGHIETVAEKILRDWANSRDIRKQTAFVEYAYGKVPNKTEVTGKDGEKLISDDRYDRGISELVNAIREGLSNEDAEQTS